ncbi:esterase/lipase family protein [Candidatus Solirubrobacter pratensis]|uniref:esterase/lipase family protein n=1 Tax=Candidatus Solirubrobacter pratensis TaxID=1298857 RepID=UPI0006845215|nr:hypothetical protein [Candidatus Solirubrobacter pratensis]
MSGKLRTLIVLVVVAVWVGSTADRVVAAPSGNPPVIYLHGIRTDACDLQHPPALIARIAAKLPQDGLSTQPGIKRPGCEDTTNPLSFHYVPDKSGIADQDIAEGGTSLSGADKNADALHAYIASLIAHGHPKTLLVGYSLGALIIRRYLAKYSDEADAHIAAVVFTEGAVQGSILAAVAGTAAHLLGTSNLVDQLRAVEDVCGLGKAATEAMGGGLPGAGLCLAAAAQSATWIDQPSSNAQRDLTPRSAIIASNAKTPLPKSIRYLNLPGSIRLIYPSLSVGLWKFQPDAVDVGDTILGPGIDDPTATPLWGGAHFWPQGDGYDAQQALIRTDCELSRVSFNEILAAIAAMAVDATAGVRNVDATIRQLTDLQRCVFDAPANHIHLPELLDTATDEQGQAASDRVVDFLVETCRKAQLGNCGADWRNHNYTTDCPVNNKVTVKLINGRSREIDRNNAKFVVSVEALATGDMTNDGLAETAVMLLCAPPGSRDGSQDVQVFAGDTAQMFAHLPRLHGINGSSLPAEYVPVHLNVADGFEIKDGRLVTDMVFPECPDGHILYTTPVSWEWNGSTFVTNDQPPDHSETDCNATAGGTGNTGGTGSSTNGTGRRRGSWWSGDMTGSGQVALQNSIREVIQKDLDADPQAARQVTVKPVSCAEQPVNDLTLCGITLYRDATHVIPMLVSVELNGSHWQILGIPGLDPGVKSPPGVKNPWGP